jgi:hypothetical protein
MNRIIHNAVVVDANMLAHRHEASLRSALEEACRAGRQIFVPRALIFETIQEGNWEQALRKDFRVVAEFRDCTFLERLPSELTRIERLAGGVAPSLVDEAKTDWFRSVLSDVLSGATGQAFAGIRRRPHQIEQYIEKERTDLLEQKQRHLLFVEHFKKQVPRESLAAAARSRSEFRKLLADGAVVSLCREHLLNLGYSHDLATYLAILPSWTSNFFYTLAAYALHYAAKQGLDSRPPRKVASDFADLLHVRLALSCEQFLTEDKKAYALWEDLCAVVDERCARLTSLLNAPV